MFDPMVESRKIYNKDLTLKRDRKLLKILIIFRVINIFQKDGNLKYL